jgi:hypothetical protein
MFTNLLKTFELPPCASGIVHWFVEAPSPPPTRARTFNKRVLDYIDLKAKQGEDSGSSSR